MRLINADALLADFKARAIKARNWKENAILNGNEEATIRADATIAFLTEVKLTIENAPTIQVCQKYNIEDHFCPTWCEAIKKTSEDLQQTYQKELDKLEKIEQICKEAFSDPETQDINLYRAQALANIYHLFLYDMSNSQTD